MQRESHQWHTGRLGRAMGLRVYGHWGMPLLAFPTSGGDEWEMEGQGMVAALEEFIDGGRIKLFCVGSNGDQSFYDKSAHPLHRSWMQRQWDEYIRWEVIPFIHSHCNGLSAIADDGRLARRVPRGQHAVQAPRCGARVLCACPGSTICAASWTGIYDDNFYFNNPIDYIGGMTDSVADRPDLAAPACTSRPAPARWSTRRTPTTCRAP